MLKRECIKILLTGLIGSVAGLIIATRVIPTLSVVLIPTMIISALYGIGTYYAWNTLLNMLKKLITNTVNYGLLSLLIRPTIGTLISIVMVVLGLLFILTIGWIIGIIKCAISVVKAAKYDKYVRTG